MNIRWSWMNVIGLLVIDILSGDSIDIAVTLTAHCVSGPCLCTGNIRFSKDSILP